MNNKTIIVRTGTQDSLIVQNVIDANEYRLPEKFDPGDLIIDIGAHIGCFALACLQRGDVAVVCFEPEEENFELLERNAPTVQKHKSAVWSSSCQLPLTVVPGHFTACHKTTGNSGELVQAVGINDVLRNYPKIRLLKIDCEGAEVAILNAATVENMSTVEAVCGEIHFAEPSKPTIPWLRQRLSDFGFLNCDVVEYPGNPTIANFFGYGRKSG